MANKQWVYGKNPVLEALRTGQNIEKIYLQIGLEKSYFNTVRKEAGDAGVFTQVVPKVKLDKLVRSNHQGVIAEMSLFIYQDLENVLPFLFEQGQTPLFLLLDGITDVRNFGAIARSAEVLGANGIILPSRGAAPLNEVAMKTSSGALSRIPVMRISRLDQVIPFLKLHGLRVYATGLDNAVDIREANLTGPLAIVMGAEDKGVSQNVLSICDGVITIPQFGELNSLNVSVATGVILYEIQRQNVSA